MLEQMYNTIEKATKDSSQSFDRLLEFLAADHSFWLLRQINPKLGWLYNSKALAAALVKAYDPKLLRSDYYDHLGEMYLEKIASTSPAKKLGQFLTPNEVAGMTAEMAIPGTQEHFRVLDPAVSSGRMLMAAHRQAPKATLFGVDIDLRMIRIALTNFAIHDLEGYLLHADSLKHEIDIGTEVGSHNWRYSNCWDSHMDKLKSRPKSRNYDLPLWQDQGGTK